MDGSPPSRDPDWMGRRLDDIRARVTQMHSRLVGVLNGFSVPPRAIPVQQPRSEPAPGTGAIREAGSQRRFVRDGPDPGDRGMAPPPETAVAGVVETVVETITETITIRDPQQEVELEQAREQAQLMASWAQDNESRLLEVQTQFQQVLMEKEQHRAQAVDLKRLADEQRDQLREARDTRKKSDHEAALHRKKNETLAARLDELEADSATLTRTVGELRVQLRTAVQKEQHLMKRVQDLKRAGKK